MIDELIEYLGKQNAVVSALFAGLFTWGVTAIGAASVFLFKGVNKKLLNGMLGFTGGVMIAASFWSITVLFCAISRVGNNRTSCKKRINAFFICLVA